MPRFYFDVREGSTFLVDENGLEFSSLDEAEQEAIRGSFQWERISCREAIRAK
jgi:hypothetical protein